MKRFDVYFGKPFHKQNRGNYSEIACGGSITRARKQTLICPVCGYTSRAYFSPFATEDHVASFHCPKQHGKLQMLGTITRIPKKGSNKFKKFMR